MNWAERKRAYDRWYVAQCRCHERWYRVTQAFTGLWLALALAPVAFDLPGWLWLLAVPPELVCHWAWKQAYTRLRDGQDYYLDELKAECGRIGREVR